MILVCIQIKDLCNHGQVIKCLINYSSFSIKIEFWCTKTTSWIEFMFQRNLHYLRIFLYLVNLVFASLLEQTFSLVSFQYSHSVVSELYRTDEKGVYNISYQNLFSTCLEGCNFLYVSTFLTRNTPKLT